MRWRYLAVACGLLVAMQASFAEGPPDTGGATSGSSPSEIAGYFTTAGVVRFQLTGGRLRLDPIRHRKGSQQVSQNDVEESISVTSERGIPSLQYAYRSPHRYLTLSVEHSEAVRIESWTPGLNRRSVLDQPKSGPITWTLTGAPGSDPDAAPEVYQGNTLLHLRAANTAAFGRDFDPLIGRLLRGRTIGNVVEETNGKLMEMMAVGDLIDPEQFQDAVDGLSAPRRVTRATSFQKLASWGTCAIPLIRELPDDRLDSEQTLQIEQLLKRTRRCTDDTGASLAALLLHDRTYWKLVLPNATAHQRELVRTRLNQRQNGGHPITPESEHQLASVVTE
ncbi:MAG: hypothetical protein AAGA03_11175 [Planctomycetota bacterium]